MQKIQIGIGGIFLAIFLLTIVYQMITRFLGISATWTEDVTQYSFIWAVFMGASAMVYEKAHFAFTSISDLIKNERIKGILSVIISCVMLVFAVAMVYYGVIITQRFWNYTWVNIPAFKRGPTWLCLPVAGVTSSIYILNQIRNQVISLMRKGVV